MIRIDAHQHFWRLSRGDYGWLTPRLEPIYRDYLPCDLAPHLTASGVDRTVLVQAAPTAAETDFLLDLAGRTPFVAGVVGWIDLEAPGAPQAVRAFAARPGALGLRPMLQDLPDDEWLLRPGLAPSFAAMAEAGLTFDALVKPRHLPALRRFLERHPHLPVVVDHGAKPDIAGREHAAWAQAMHALARETHAVCKLSGLVTEARPDWTVADLRPYAETLLEAFGPSRLMWGSDWPVVNRAADYGRWAEATEILLSDLPEADRAAIMGGTAQAFYGVQP
ncbi:amidohydrolase [Phenylobacterium sp.]|uniref:amidohydrolase family protein n=1 Tax=Phenylobacterium sp. TaxID=1871053 RepID=UPI0025E90DE8|nr:amidohydrolase family protein [Phenylobacterium sp.]